MRAHRLLRSALRHVVNWLAWLGWAYYPTAITMRDLTHGLAYPPAGPPPPAQQLPADHPERIVPYAELTEEARTMLQRLEERAR